MVKLLVNFGACVTRRNGMQVSPLQVVHEGGDIELSRYMVNTFLEQACQSNGKYTDDDIKEAIDIERNLSDCKKYSRPVLLWVCSIHGTNSPHVVEVLLKKNIDKSAADEDGMAAIHLACLHIGSHTGPLISTLEKGGCNIRATNTDGQTALHVAVENSDEHIEEVLDQLLQSGVSVNSADGIGNTPLHLACGSSKPTQRKVVHWLVQHGADWKYRNNEGNTPYDIAKRQGSATSQKVLMNEILLKYCQDTKKLEPDRLKTFVKMGADINCTDANGNSVLHLVVFNGIRNEFTSDNIAAIKDLGVKLKSQNDDKNTAYEIGVFSGLKEDILSLLIGDGSEMKLPEAGNSGKGRPTQKESDGAVGGAAHITTVKSTDKEENGTLEDVAEKAESFRDAAKELIGSAANAVGKRLSKIFD